MRHISQLKNKEIDKICHQNILSWMQSYDRDFKNEGAANGLVRFKLLL
jgi:hypothetical protein